MRLDLTIAGDKQFSRELLGVGARALNMKPVLHEVADFWKHETELNFESEGRHASGGWKELSPAYLAEKLRHRPRLDPRILHASDALFDSLTLDSDPNQILKVTKSELLFGTKLAYAEAHQNPKPGSRLPRRRPVEFTASARIRTVKLLQRYVMTGEVGLSEREAAL